MKGRTALITGGSAGIGLAFAHQLAARGCAVILVARRAEKLEAAAEAVRARASVEVHTLVGDLSDPACPRRLFEEVEALGLHVDILVNNAGSQGPHLLEDRDWEANARFMELMVTSVAHMCHRFIPPMQANGYGRVINVASVAGRVPRPAGVNYGPAKAWVIAMSEELAMVVEGSGVHVTALCPGFTHTEFHAEGDAAEVKARLPGFLWYDVDTVVAEGLAAVERGRAVQISGRLYRWVDPLLRAWWMRPVIRAMGR